MKHSRLPFACLLVPALGLGTGLASAQQNPQEVVERNVVASRPAAEKADERAAASEVVVREVQAFYRDLAARQWNDLQNHFWGAKIAARWPSPFGNPGSSLADESLTHSSAGSLGRSEETGPCGEPGQAVPRQLAITWAGKWARVVSEPCRAAGDTQPASSRRDELWLFEFGGVWKIVYLREAR